MRIRRFLAVICLACCVLALRAVPADRTPVVVPQADGDSLTLVLVGDEFFHYQTTLDGYTVLRSAAGAWEYARRAGERLASTGVLAHDAARRSAAETALLATLDRHITDRTQCESGLQQRMSRDRQLARPNREPVVDYSAFRGLIVLINFTDKKFQMPDPSSFYTDMVNTRNYSGFNFNNRFYPCTGSLRDYFTDQSLGQFSPEFDVAGPVEVPFSCLDCGENAGDVFTAALQLIDDDYDFSQYDSDNNGQIDMVFFLVAGYAANFSGNNQGYLWPHMSYLDGYYDEMYMGRYASSTEIFGWEAYNQRDPNGIGTMCHEFSHVLGLPDLYDTDYAGGGGQSFDPGRWDVMANGSGNNTGRTPVGYSMWERQQLGWSEPTLLGEGDYTLPDVSKTGEGFVLTTSVDDEMFYLENRQNEKWDSALPGHGLLVARVDYSNPRAWQWNRVNADPEHNYYELVRSRGSEEATTFPGPGNVNSLNAVTSPALQTWNGSPCELGLSAIAEADGIITFSVLPITDLYSMVEDFEQMAAFSDVRVEGVQGNFATWDFVQAEVGADTHFDSQQACALAMPSTMTMTTNIDADIYQVTLDTYNPSSQDAKLQLAYSYDNGATWSNIGSSVAIEGMKPITLTWKPQINRPVRFRLTRNGGSRTQPLYIDNLTIHYIGEQREVGIYGDVDGNGKVEIDDMNIIINVMMHIDDAPAHIAAADVDGNGKVEIDDMNIVLNVLLKIE